MGPDKKSGADDTFSYLFEVYKATEGCKVLKKVVSGVNLADPAQTSTCRSSFISAYFKDPQYILILTTLEYYFMSI